MAGGWNVCKSGTAARPLPNAEQTPIGWDDARALVLDAYGGFSPKMADIARPFFDKGWIDAGVKDGKAPGAFCHPAVSDAHPFVMLNYMGQTARCDDSGARIGTRSASGFGGGARRAVVAYSA